MGIFGVKSIHISDKGDLFMAKKVLTPDLGGHSSTSEVGDELCRILSR